MTKILRLPEVMTTTGLSRSGIYDLIREKKFPQPIPLGKSRAVGWLSTELDDWITSRVAMRKDNNNTL